jgi:hypothetical protein
MTGLILKESVQLSQGTAQKLLLSRQNLNIPLEFGVLP